MDQNSDDSNENDESNEDTHKEPKRNKISLVHINCQSLKNKLAKLEIEAEEHDVVLLTETWLHKDIANNELVLDGFENLARKDREEDRYGGMAIYCRSEIPVKETKEIQVRGTESV